MSSETPEDPAGHGSGKGEGQRGKATADTATQRAAGESDAMEDDGGGLVFRWRANRGRVFALFFFAGVALLVHAAGFYLFQVTPTISARVEAQPARVTLLDPADPTTAALLREVDDRLVFLRPASLGAGSRLRIEDYSVAFRPSFMQRRVPFRRPLASDSLAEPLQELLPPDGLILPAVERPPEAVAGVLEDSADSKPAESRWQIGGDLEDRPLAEGALEAFDAALAQRTSGPAVKLQVWVDASGRVVNVLPLSGTEQTSNREVVQVLRTHLRFAPRPGAPLQSGEISVGQ